MRFLERALLASCKNRTQLSPLNIAFTYDYRRILKHVLCVVCICRKDVVGLIDLHDAIRVVPAWRKRVACDVGKIIPSKSPLTLFTTTSLKTQNTLINSNKS